MDPKIVGVIVVVVLVAIVAAIMFSRRRQGERLRDAFGTEYDRQVEEAGGSRPKAEAELLKREKRVREARHPSAAAGTEGSVPGGLEPSAGRVCR